MTFVARAEMVLARDPIWGLRNVPLTPDPLTPLAFAMGGLESGETLDVVMDLVPLTSAEQQKWVGAAVAKYEKTQGSLGGGVGSQIRAELVKGTQWESSKATRPQVGALTRRRSATKERHIQELLGREEPHFRMQLLLRASSPVRGRAPVILLEALASFDVLGGGQNWLRVKGRRVLGRYWGSDALWNKQRFDRRFDSGRVTPPRINRVGATSIGSLLKPPTASCAADNIVRSDGIIALPPRDLPEWKPGQQLWPLGVVRSRNDEDFIGAVPLDDTLFTLTNGTSGFGKTEGALSRILATIDAGQGVMFIDPHGDAIDRLKPYLVEDKHRVLELTLELGQSQQAGWNPFAISYLNELEERMTSITDSLAASIGWKHGVNNRALGITLNAVRTLLELSLQLPPKLKPTIFQLTTLLSDEEWRNEVVGLLSKQTQDYWNRFAYKPGEFTPLTSLVDRLRTARSISALLGATDSTFDLRKEMDRGGVVLVRLRGTGDLDKLLASLLIYGVLESLLGRRDTGNDGADRKPFHIWIDEAQIVDAAVQRMLSAIAEQTRKFGGRMHLLTQAPQRLSKLTMTALMTNRSHLLTSSLNAEGASMITKEWGGAVSAQSVQRLNKYQFIGQVRLHGETSEPFRIGGVHLDELFGHKAQPDRVEELAKQIAINTGYQPVDKTLEILDSLDEEILSHLRAARARPTENYLRAVKEVSPYKPDNVRSSQWRHGE